jgi:dipeptidyl aminopeptidase/acylaminoacyl peptidase
MRRFLFICFATVFCLPAQTSLDRVAADLDKLRAYPEAAISPDAKWVLWGEQLSSATATSSLSLRSLANDGEPTREISASSAHGAAWSPDSTHFAFLAPDTSSEDSHQDQIYTAQVSARGAIKTHKLTSLKGYLASLKWSPDGHKIAFLFIDNSPRKAGPLEAVTPAVGVIDEAAFAQRVAIVDVASGKVSTPSPADLYVHEYDWSPNSDGFVFTAAPLPGDDNWYVAKLYTLSLATGEQKMIFETPLQMAVPRWSPDGSAIAFIAGVMSDEGSTGGEVYTVPAGGGEALDRTPGRKSSPSWLHWLPSSQRMILAENTGGSSAISTLDLKTGTTETLWTSGESISAGGEELSASNDGASVALVRSSWSMAPEVFAGPPGKWRQITHGNDSAKPLWGESKDITWSSDGFDVQGWLVQPANYDPSRRYPMIVAVHGGPGALAKPSWPHSTHSYALLSTQGYFVFFPNPRGSFGQGEAFTRGNVKDLGYGDLRDILAGVDAVVKQYPVDEKRIGITGWSYGGYMTMWAVTQTQRFRAAVSGAGIANLQSYYGQNPIDQWMVAFFGASVYDDPAIYAKSSPISFIKNVKTPTLVLVGDRDGECPAPQSFEFWHALKTLGVKTQLVVYPNEGHAFHDPKHIRDLMDRTVNWFNENMK